VGPSKAEEILSAEEGREGSRGRHTGSGLDFQKMVPG